MNKCRLLIVAIAMLPIFSEAQAEKKIEFSLKGGLNYFSQNFKQVGEMPVPKHIPQIAYVLGSGASLSIIPHLLLEVDLLYKSKYSELKEFCGVEWGNTFYKFQYIALPVLIHGRIPAVKPKVSLILGLEADFLINSKIDDKKNDIVIDPVENMRSIDVQFIMGVGIKYNTVSFELRYGKGLLNLNSKIEDKVIVKNSGFEFILSWHFWTKRI